MTHIVRLWVSGSGMAWVEGGCGFGFHRDQGSGHFTPVHWGCCGLSGGAQRQAHTGGAMLWSGCFGQRTTQLSTKPGVCAEPSAGWLSVVPPHAAALLFTEHFLQGRCCQQPVLQVWTLTSGEER